VFCPLPPETIEALKAIQAEGEHYFWSGVSKPKSAVGDYQRALRTLFDNAETPRVHAHLFRHTFATELLTLGNSLETVAALLGHSSTKVTERSYSHWVKGRQEKLEEQSKIRGHNWAQLNHALSRINRKPNKHAQKDMVEAGGVEPPSEKRYATEPTCLSQFRLVCQPRLERARNAAG
jgi:Phage integrase family